MSPRIANLGEWRGHLLARLRREVAATQDPLLASLLSELSSYPGDDPAAGPELPGPGEIVVPLRLRHEAGELAFMSTVTTFGTPLDVTVSDLSIEAFFPADAHTAAVLRSLVGWGRGARHLRRDVARSAASDVWRDRPVDFRAPRSS